MRILVTGASGFIGSAVVAELISHGHDVIGLARSDVSAQRVAALAAEVLRGDLDDPAVLAEAARGADGVVHLGFKHDFSAYADAGRTERAVIEAFGDALAGSGKPFLFAAGVAGIAPGRVVTEDDPNPGVGVEAPRGGAENLALSFADRGVRPVSLRFAPTVHGEGDHGFVAALAAAARRHGVSATVGDGANRWPAVHRSDVASLVRLALEKAPAGAVLHGVGERALPFWAIAEAIARALGVPTGTVTTEDAPAHFGPLGMFFAADIPASSVRTQELLGWVPRGDTLLDDIAAGHYPGE